MQNLQDIKIEVNGQMRSVRPCIQKFIKGFWMGSGFVIGAFVWLVLFTLLLLLMFGR